MTLVDTFISHGTDPEVARAAVKALDENPDLQGIVVSGKIAAGKDTLAPLLLGELDSSNPFKQLQFAFTLKNEVSQLLEIIRSEITATGGEDTEATLSEQPEARKIANMIAEQQGIPFEQALTVLSYVRDEFLNGTGPVDGWDKTPGNRKVLQMWGTEVRRAQNDNYWVDKVVQAAAQAFVEGHSVFVTDARFVNELEGAASLGFTSFRIDVSPEEQKRRFRLRESGAELQHEATLHPSETSLDDYEHFMSRVLTDNMSPKQAVAALMLPLTDSN